MQSSWKKFWPDFVAARNFEGLEDEPELVENIVSLGKILGLEVTEDDVELMEEHRTELPTEELIDLLLLLHSNRLQQRSYLQWKRREGIMCPLHLSRKCVLNGIK